MTKLMFHTTVAMLLASAMAFSQILSNGTGGGDWNTGTTWVGGNIPTSTDDVVIQAGDNVTLAAAGSCSNLSMVAGSTITLSGAAIPGSTWSLDPASTVVYATTTTVQSAVTYGNLVYSSVNGGPNGNLTVMGDLTVTTATLRGISATSGSFTHTVHGDVVIGPGGSARISCVNSSSATTATCTWNFLGNVSLTGNSSGNRLILFESAGPHTTTATVNITGNVTLGAGSVIHGRSSTTANVNSCVGTVNIAGDIISSGSINTSSGGTGSDIVIRLNGTTPQTYTGTLPINYPAGQTCTVVIDNPAGVTLANAASVNTNDALTLSTGKLTTTSTNLLTVSATGTIGGGNASSFVDGPLAIAVASTSPTTLTFPVGKGTAYRPVALTLTHDAATTTTYTAEVFNTEATSRNLGALTRVSHVRYYAIAQSAGANVTDGSIELSYASDEPVDNTATLRIAKDDGAGNWVDLGGTGTAPTTGSITSTTSFTTFGDFVLASADANNPLPITLASFAATRLEEQRVRVAWETLSEINNFGFEVQRSASLAGDFSTVSPFIPGAGTTNDPHSYTFVDESALAGASWYRLKQTDLDGTVHYTDPVGVDLPTSVTDVAPSVFALEQNYPNPFNPATEIRFSVEATGRATLDVYDALGQHVATLFDAVAEAGHFTTVRFNASHLATGMYYYRLVSGNRSEVRKLLLMK